MNLLINLLNQHAYVQINVCHQLFRTTLIDWLDLCLSLLLKGTTLTAKNECTFPSKKHSLFMGGARSLIVNALLDTNAVRSYENPEVKCWTPQNQQFVHSCEVCQLGFQPENIGLCATLTSQAFLQWLQFLTISFCFICSNGIQVQVPC